MGIRRPLGLKSGIGRWNRGIYRVQDGYHGPSFSYYGHPVPYNGHRKAPYLCIISGIRGPNWALYQVQEAIVALLGIGYDGLSEYRKVSYALYLAYDGQTRPCMRYKTVTMDLSSVMTTILGLIMGIGNTPGPYFGHMVVKSGLTRYKTAAMDLPPVMTAILYLKVGVWKPPGRCIAYKKVS